MPDSPPYCFISYSRDDTALAQWLQRQLESYKYPVTLVREERRPSDPIRLRPIFLDTSDLSISSGPFWEEICTKIDLSRYLLVLCSRASASSRYVNDEIARFIGEDGGRLDRIILAIIDPAINLSSPAAEDFPPQILRHWDRLSPRNHPVLLPKEGEGRSSARQRGLTQIVSFMLGVEWTVLYNRYLIARRKVYRRTATISIAILAAIAASLAWALWKERELSKFEREVFPYSLVVAYTDNFLSPLITSLEKRPDKPLIIIALPNSYAELNHAQRVKYYRDSAAKVGYTAVLTKVETSLPRGAETALITPTPPYFKDRQMEVYIDFASAVVSFGYVIEYKKKNPAYKHTPRNQMLLEYAAEFEKSVMEELKANDKHPDQRDRIVFVRSPSAALQILAHGR